MESLDSELGHKGHQTLAPASVVRPLHSSHCQLQGTICWLAMHRIRHAVHQRLGSTSAKAFLLLTAAQFHLPFYMSRTLPNTFATTILGFATADWVTEKHPKRLICELAFATVRFLSPHKQCSFVKQAGVCTLSWTLILWQQQD